VPTMIKAPPTPTTSLPRRAAGKVLAKAVAKLPTATEIRDKKPISRKPYLLTTSPAGKARNIPGTITADISKPACASVKSKSDWIVLRSGGANWKTKAKATKVRKHANNKAHR